MTGVAIIPFDRVRSTLPDDVSLRRYDLGKGIPVIRIEYAVPQMLYLVIKSSECCAITTTQNPGNSSPAAAVKGFDNPKFCFFDSM